MTALGGLLCVGTWRPVTLLGQSHPAAQEGPPRHFLFVVESSRSMKPRGQATLDVMQALLNSGFDGQMRAGDFLDAWAYNDALHKVGAPAQADSQEARATLSVRLLDFVMSQSSEKKASFDKVLPELQLLLRETPFITVILLSSGENEFHGSVCDGLINNSFKRLHERQQQAQKPLVTVIRSIAGLVTDCNVVAPPDRVKMPLLPEEVRQLETAIGARAPVPPEPPKSTTSTGLGGSTNSESTSKTDSSPVAQQAAAQPLAAAASPSTAPLAASALSATSAPNSGGVEPPQSTAQVTPSAPPNQSASEPVTHEALTLERPSPSGQGMLAVSAPSAPPRSFLRENGKFLVLAFGASLVAAFCFYNWLRTFSGRSGK